MKWVHHWHHFSHYNKKDHLSFSKLNYNINRHRKAIYMKENCLCRQQKRCLESLIVPIYSIKRNIKSVDENHNATEHSVDI